MSKTEKFIALEEQHGAHNYHPLDIVIRKAEGVWVEDVEGKRYLDFLAAYSAVNQGHCHPRLLKVFRRQAAGHADQPRLPQRPVAAVVP